MVALQIRKIRRGGAPREVNPMRNKTSATAEAVARWLLGEVSLEGPLDRHQTAEELEGMFGPNIFTVTDDVGRLVISRQVVTLLEDMAHGVGVAQVWRDG
jgi:hypothetical protein